MKEAFWGFLIICLGLIGIVIIQLFQNVTITNDQTYYLLKEVTEASIYDSIDLTYYRTKGKIRIVEDKFVENFTRRFAESADLNRNYNIRIHDIVEEPPKVSLSIGTYVFSIQGEQFNIAQNIDAILEAKYDEKDITGKDPIIEDPIIEEPIIEEPDVEEGLCPTCEVGDPNCSNGSTCISGDLRFVGWEDVTVPAYLCKGVAVSQITRNASYQSCECGNWVDKSNQITSTGSVTVTHYLYNWNFTVESAIKKLNESDNKASKYGICTTIIDITETGVSCPAGGFDIRIGDTLTLRPSYTPPNSINRNLLWTTNNDNISLQYSMLNIGLAEFNDAVVTGKKVGTSTVTVKTTNNKTDTCKIEVLLPLPTCVSSGGNSIWTNDNITLTGICVSTNGSGCSPAKVTKSYSSDINSTTETPGTVCNTSGPSNPKNCVTCPVQTVKIDKTKPTISLSNPSGGACTTGNVVITYTAKDALSGLSKVQYKSASSGTWIDANNKPTYGSNSYSSTITFTAIRHEDMNFRSIDVVGNVSDTVSTHIQKANSCVVTPSVLTVSCPKDPISNGESTICSLDQNVSGALLKCYNNGALINSYTTTSSSRLISCTPYNSGTLTVEATKTGYTRGSTTIGVYTSITKCNNANISLSRSGTIAPGTTVTASFKLNNVLKKVFWSSEDESALYLDESDLKAKSSMRFKAGTTERDVKITAYYPDDNCYENKVVTVKAPLTCKYNYLTAKIDNGVLTFTFVQPEYIDLGDINLTIADFTNSSGEYYCRDSIYLSTSRNSFWAIAQIYKGIYMCASCPKYFRVLNTYYKDVATGGCGNIINCLLFNRGEVVELNSEYDQPPWTSISGVL